MENLYLLDTIPIIRKKSDLDMWLSLVEFLAVELKLDHYLFEEERDMYKISPVSHALYARMKMSIQYHEFVNLTSDCKTANQIWFRLNLKQKEVLEKSYIDNHRKLTRFNIRTTSPEEDVKTMESLVKSLKKCGWLARDKDLIAIYLAALPDEFSITRQIWECSDVKTSERLVSLIKSAKLPEVEAKAKQEKVDKPTNHLNKCTKNIEICCSFCQGSGHKKENCYSYKESKGDLEGVPEWFLKKKKKKNCDKKVEIH